MTARLLERALRPLRNRVANMVARVVVETVRDGNLQVLQVSGLAEETLAEVEHIQQYGFTSHPFAGAEGAAVFVMGDRSHGLVIAVDDRRYRLKGLAEGEVALYDDLGQKVVLERTRIRIETTQDVSINVGGDAEIVAGGDVKLDAGGNVDIDAAGNVDIDADGDATINAAGIVNLGGVGGKPVARLGDSIETVTDTITGGSVKVFAVD